MSMQTDTAKDYFELFGLPVGFELDSELLALRYRELQQAVHPDRFAGGTDLERRLAVQQASRVNEGYRILRSPLARARYLLELWGVGLDDTNTISDPGFLMAQMELREALAEVRGSRDPFVALAAVRDDIERRDRILADELRSAFDDGSPEALARARACVLKMQFMHKLLDEVAILEEDLVHEG